MTDSSSLNMTGGTLTFDTNSNQILALNDSSAEWTTFAPQHTDFENQLNWWPQPEIPSKFDGRYSEMTDLVCPISNTPIWKMESEEKTYGQNKYVSNSGEFIWGWFGVYLIISFGEHKRIFLVTEGEQGKELKEMVRLFSGTLYQQPESPSRYFKIVAKDAWRWVLQKLKLRKHPHYDFENSLFTWDLVANPGFSGAALPLVKQIAASTIGHDLVSVQPLEAPKGLLFYMDPKTDEPEPEAPYYGNEKPEGSAEQIDDAFDIIDTAPNKFIR